MNDTLVGKLNRESAETQDSKYCSACRELLDPDSIFCANCGPPEAPDPDPEGENAPISEALLRITALVLVFVLIAFFKLDLTLENMVPDFAIFAPEEVEEEIPTDEDFAVYHTITVPQANLRETASLKGKIIAVLKRGEQFEILEAQGKWSKVKIGERTGWVSSKLLTLKVR